jgi:cyclophilin family peptidyl-prolyl cis-trans isomerase
MGLMRLAALAILFAGVSFSQRPDGLYAEVRTSKGLIVARLEFEMTPMTVASFVGLAEGTIENAAFDLGRPFYDGTVWHRVVPGHVIQTGQAKSAKSQAPGYQFPNEIHRMLNHDRAGMLNMANSGPGTNASQFCITLADRSYLNGDFNVFGEVVEGLDTVMRIARGDIVESIRIVRLGAKAQTFHPTTESFREMVKTAEAAAAEHEKRKRSAEEDWVTTYYAGATRVTEAKPAPTTPLRVRYSGIELRYVGDVIDRVGPPIEEIRFGSGASGVPAFENPPLVFTIEPGKTKINPGLDGVIGAMSPGERKTVVVPAELAYGRAGSYPPEVPGKRRFIVSPKALLVYRVEALSR